MAFRYGLPARFGLLAAAVALSTTMAAASPGYPVGTVTSTSSYDNSPAIEMVIVLDTAYREPLFDMPIFAEPAARIASSFPPYRASAAKERVPAAAVQATSVAGQRTGRTRRLSG